MVMLFDGELQYAWWVRKRVLKVSGKWQLHRLGSDVGTEVVRQLLLQLFHFLPIAG